MEAYAHEECRLRRRVVSGGPVWRWGLLALVEGVTSRPLHRLPRAWRRSAPGVRGQRVLEAAHEEHRAPALPVVAPELKVVFLPSRPRHDVTDPGPVVEPAM